MSLAPSINNLTWVKGEPVDLTYMSGHPVIVLEIWATWCPPCRTTIPHLTELQHQYGDQVIFIGVSSESVSQVRPFVDQMGIKMDYRVAVDVNGEVQSKYMDSYNVNGIPHCFVISKKGKVLWHGHPVEEMLQVTIDQAMSEGPV